MNLHQVWIAPVRPSIRYVFICTAPWLILFFPLAFAGYYFHTLFTISSWICLLAFFYHVFLLNSHSYLITPEYFLISKGLLNKKVEWVEHLQVKDYDIHQNFYMRLVDVVSITITGNEQSAAQFTLKGVSKSKMKIAFSGIIDFLEVRKNYYQNMLDTAEALAGKAKAEGLL